LTETEGGKDKSNFFLILRVTLFALFSLLEYVPGRAQVRAQQQYGVFGFYSIWPI
jgi:hypothetical protein